MIRRAKGSDERKKWLVATRREGKMEERFETKGDRKRARGRRKGNKGLKMTK